MAENKDRETQCLVADETLRSDSKLTATGEEHLATFSSTSHLSREPVYTRSIGTSMNEDGSLKPQGQLSTNNSARKTGKELNKYQPLKIGTWNVRTMNKAGKLENLKAEMIKLKVDVIGVSEVRWKGTGDIISGDTRFIYSGGENAERGVGILLNKKIANNVTKVDQKHDRLLYIKIKADPVDIVMIQVYMPTTAHDDDEVEKIYEDIEEIIKEDKSNNCFVIMGDFNAVVGEERNENIVGKYGLGNKNERGEMLIEFCKRNDLILTNTWFQNEKRRRYTWKNPGDTERYQIDYILINQRYRNSVKNSKSYPGADIDSDHNLVMMKMNIIVICVIFMTVFIDSF